MGRAVRLDPLGDRGAYRLSATVAQLEALLLQMGSNVTYHREDGGVACPCRTPEGFRDPAWHRANPLAPICNEQGYLVVATEFQVKASIQPAISGLSRAAQRSNDLLGEVKQDDHLGVFPCTWQGHTLDFDSWSAAGEDFIVYDGKRYVIVAADKLPDIDGDPSHHWEVGLRLVKTARPL